jgi:hypothetical protein
MITVRTISIAALITFAAAAPAAADRWNTGAINKGGGTTAPSKPPVQSTPVPEPADFALFGAGIAGLLLGRRSSRSRKNRRDGE